MLTERLDKHRAQVRRLLHDEAVPLGNNAAKRSICKLKVQRKAMGSCPTEARAHRPLAIRSAFSSSREQVRPVPGFVLQARAGGRPVIAA